MPTALCKLLRSQSTCTYLYRLIMAHTEFFFFLLELTEPNTHGTPLQYSCLENPMDGGAW